MGDLVPLEGGEAARLERRRRDAIAPYSEGPGRPDDRAAIAWEIEFDSPDWQAAHGMLSLSFNGRCLDGRLSRERRAEIMSMLLPILRRLVVDEFAAELAQSSSADRPR